MSNQPSNQRKMKHVIKWTVHPMRRDKRTGATRPVPMDSYTKYAFDEIERQFKK